jgi:hypothetical protein
MAARIYTRQEQVRDPNCVIFCGDLEKRTPGLSGDIYRLLHLEQRNLYERLRWCECGHCVSLGCPHQPTNHHSGMHEVALTNQLPSVSEATNK